MSTTLQNTGSKSLHDKPSGKAGEPGEPDRRAGGAVADPHPVAAAEPAAWPPGDAPVAVILITLDEAHNMDAVLTNLSGWAREVFVVDSHSADETVALARRRGARVVRRRFRGFGDQWNFAVRELPVTAPWTMKLDPDERLTDRLKASIVAEIGAGGAAGFSFDRRLHFMGRPLPVRQRVVRVWRTGRCRFTDAAVNEHPIVDGSVRRIAGLLEHHDSPDLDHWVAKQNRYTTAEAAACASEVPAGAARLFGPAHERRRWLKRHFTKLPFRYALLFLHHYLLQGAWRAGSAGWRWSWMRCFVYRLQEYKLREMRRDGPARPSRFPRPGPPPPGGAHRP
jgi:glycosyltransferase involved in cell wall biosynthesis